MTNELKMIEALQNVAKSFGYNAVYFTADRRNGVTIHFKEPDVIEFRSDEENIVLKGKKNEK